MADLNVNIGELQMKNPVMTASGTFGYGEEFADFIDIARIGGVIVKGTTLHKREGNPYPRMAETPSGMLNAVGLQNKGVHYFVDTIYPRIKDVNTNMIVNVSGSAIEDYVETASIINELVNNRAPYFYLDGQTIALVTYLKNNPDKKEIILNLIKENKLAIGPYYVIPDSYLVGFISTLKNIDIGQEISKEFGIKDYIGYLSDIFGISK